MYDWTKDTGSVKNGRGFSLVCRLSPIVRSLYTRCLTEGALGVFGDFGIGGKVIRTV
jgi:hypothetical protein